MLNSKNNYLKIVYGAVVYSTFILFCNQSYAQQQQIALFEIKKTPPAKVKLGIKSTQTEFGAMAVP